jgi:precorrin-2 dehydrogenase / sirohydrochlorin ferrochelatase
MLDGARFNALVVGGGAVAARKAKSLLDGGMTVTVVAPEICSELMELAAAQSRLRLMERVYQPSDVAQASIIVAATNDSRVNTAVARDATTRGLLVNVADDPTAGNFITPSVHRSGDLTIAVSSGRTPAVAAAVRAEIAKRFDERYAVAIRSLRALRERLLGSGRREEWKRASRELVTEQFCDQVEQGRVEEQVASWR